MLFFLIKIALYFRKNDIYLIEKCFLKQGITIMDNKKNISDIDNNNESSNPLILGFSFGSSIGSAVRLLLGVLTPISIPIGFILGCAVGSAVGLMLGIIYKNINN